MVRFSSTAAAERRSAAVNTLRNDRRRLRRLREEKAALLRELEELRLLRELSHLVSPLTGTLDRRLFETRLTEELARAVVSPSYRGAVLAADLNELERPPGDSRRQSGRRLQGAADIIRQALRSSDVFCRTTDDAFLILLPETDRLEARTVMSRLRVAVIRAGARQNVPVSIALGCASWSAGIVDSDQILRRADRSMRAEKRRLGRRATSGRPPGNPRKLTLVK